MPSLYYTNMTSLWAFHQNVIHVLLDRTKYKTQMEEKLKTPEILEKYSSSAFVELVSPVAHSANSVGVRGYSSG